nr:MAG TPA: hypothetical protein [Caudoviricetes sp.]
MHQLQYISFYISLLKILLINLVGNTKVLP